MKSNKRLTITEAIAGFCDHLRTNNRSSATISAYRRDLVLLVQVAENLISGLSCHDFSPQLIDQTFSSPNIRETNRGLRSQASLHRMKAAVRSFFGWTFSSGITVDNPARMIRMQRLSSKPPTFLTKVEKKRLLKELKGRTGTINLRDRVMIEILLGTGIRLAELSGLDIPHVDLASKHLRVKAKGNIEQVKFLKTDLRSLLHHYLLKRKRYGQPNCEALFLSNRLSRLSKRQIANRISHWLKKAGIDKHITPHGMRHTFATHLYSATNDLLVVQRALDHKDISTTQIYTHLVDGQLEEALERL